MERDQIDVIDLIINTLKEHEAFMDKLSARLEGMLKIMTPLYSHSLDREKLDKIEEFIEFRKSDYMDKIGLGVHLNPNQVVRDFDRILEEIGSNAVP